MARAHRHQMDEDILDRAAALFAQHGFAHTSLKTVADAVGLSKAGLLHHFPSKEALFAAAREVVREQGRRVLDQISALPPGPARDRRALELLTDVALDRPGLVSLAFSATHGPGTGEPPKDDHAHVFEMFGVDPEAGDPARLVRVIGAVSALAVLSLAANQHGEKTVWRPHIIATCVDALGHAQKD